MKLQYLVKHKDSQSQDFSKSGNFAETVGFAKVLDFALTGTFSVSQKFSYLQITEFPRLKILVIKVHFIFMIFKNNDIKKYQTRTS